MALEIPDGPLEPVEQLLLYEVEEHSVREDSKFAWRLHRLRTALRWLHKLRSSGEPASEWQDAFNISFADVLIEEEDRYGF